MEFQPKKSFHNQWCIQMVNCPKNVMRAIKSVVMNNWMNHPDYQMKEGVNPFIQSYEEKNNHILVEFWSDDQDKILDYCIYLEKRLTQDFVNSFDWMG